MSKICRVTSDYRSITLMFILIMVSAGVKAAGYGAIEITSVGLDGPIARDTIVIHAKSYVGGSPDHVQECSSGGWWWPAGTSFAFWLPRAGNEEEYALLLAAYAAKKKVWVQVTNEANTSLAIPCKVANNIYIGDY